MLCGVPASKSRRVFEERSFLMDDGVARDGAARWVAGEEMAARRWWRGICERWGEAMIFEVKEADGAGFAFWKEAEGWSKCGQRSC